MRPSNGETTVHDCQETPKQKYVYDNSTFKMFAFASAQVTTQDHLIFTHFVPVVDIDPDSNRPPFSHLPSSEKNSAGARLSSLSEINSPIDALESCERGAALFCAAYTCLTVVFFIPVRLIVFVKVEMPTF